MPQHFLMQSGDGRTVRAHKAGDVLFTEGEPSSAVYYLQNGKAKETVISRQGKPVMVSILEEGSLAGYGVARPTRNGYKVGPLFAKDVFLAERILSGLAEGVWGARLQIDVPELNPIALEMIESLGFERVFDCGRMYKGPKPALPAQFIFGTTSLEFG